MSRHEKSSGAMSGRRSEAMGEISADSDILFYDDLPTNRIKMVEAYPFIATVAISLSYSELVNQAEVDDISKKNPDRLKSVYPMLPIFSGNTYAQYLMNTRKLDGGEDDYYGEPHIPTVGITPDNMMDLDRWIDERDGRPSIIMFDLDQCFWQVNSLFIFDYDKRMFYVSGEPTITYEDVGTYIMGGPDRLGMMRHLCSKILANKNIKVIFLTNNRGAAQGATQRYFLRLLDTITGFKIEPFVKPTGRADSRRRADSRFVLIPAFMWGGIKHEAIESYVKESGVRVKKLFGLIEEHITTPLKKDSPDEPSKTSTRKPPSKSSRKGGRRVLRSGLRTRKNMKKSRKTILSFFE